MTIVHRVTMYKSMPKGLDNISSFSIPSSHSVRARVRVKMAVLFLVSIILASIVVSSTVGEVQNYCPPWMVFENGICLCRNLHIMTVFCDPKTQVTYTVAGTCVTYANSTNREIVIGDCPYVPAKPVSYVGRFLTALGSQKMVSIWS